MKNIVPSVASKKKKNPSTPFRKNMKLTFINKNFFLYQILTSSHQNFLIALLEFARQIRLQRIHVIENRYQKEKRKLKRQEIFDWKGKREHRKDKRGDCLFIIKKAELVFFNIKRRKEGFIRCY